MDGLTEAQLQLVVADLADLGLNWGLRVLGALLILIAGWTIANAVQRAIRAGLGRIHGLDATVRLFLSATARYLLLALTVLVVLGQFGVQTASIIAVLGAAGIAVGLALQGTLSNVAAGLMLLFLRPFRVGEFIDAGGLMGTVDEIGLFVTEMRTPEGRYMAVPNSRIWGGSIVNFSRNPTLRVDLVVGVAYDAEIDRALAVVGEEVRGHADVLAEPAPLVAVNALGESSVDILARFWAPTAKAYLAGLELRRRLKVRLDAEGIEIPFPQRTLHVVQPPGTGAETPAALPAPASLPPATKG